MSYRDSGNRDSYSRRPSNDNNMGQFGGYRVYVGDIGQRMGKTDLEREFGQYGPVTDVWMGRKRDPAAKNYAFVVYRYPQDAEEAVRDRNGRKVCGRKVRVEHAKPVNSNPRRQRGSWGGRGGGGRDYGPSRGGPPQRRRSWSRERYSRRGHPNWPILITNVLQPSSPKRVGLSRYRHNVLLLLANCCRLRPFDVCGAVLGPSSGRAIGSPPKTKHK